MNALLVCASLLPALAILVYFYRSDRFPEPKNTIAAVAVMGALSIIAALPLAAMLEGLRGLWSFPYGPQLFDAFVLAAFVEEFTRFLIVFAVAQTPEFDEPMDGPVYAVAAAMGFAAVENLAYVAQGGLPVAVVRAVTAVPFHAANGAILGYLVALGRFLPDRRREFYGLALAIPILVHGLYDGCLMISEAAGSTTPFQGPLQLFWGAGLWIVFDVAFRLHRHLAVIQSGPNLPWWLGRLPFGRESPRLDPVFRKLTGLSQLDSADLARLGAAAARGHGARAARETASHPGPAPRSGRHAGSGRVFRCPHCQATVTSVVLRPGESARCAGCGQDVPVPGAPRDRS